MQFCAYLLITFKSNDHTYRVILYLAGNIDNIIAVSRAQLVTVFGANTAGDKRRVVQAHVSLRARFFTDPSGIC